MPELLDRESWVGAEYLQRFGALSGEFTWKCEKGRVKGTLLLAPTRPPRIQALRLSRAN